MQNDTLSAQHLFSVVSEITVWIDVSIERDGPDAQLLAKLSYRRVAVCHGGLRHAHLGFCERELPSPFPPARPGRLKTGHGALADQFALKFGESNEDAEGKATGGGCRIDLRPLSGEHLEADTALGQHGDGFDQMMQAAAHSVELPDEQSIAVTQRLEAGFQPRSFVFFARCAIGVDLALCDIGGNQGVPLQVQGLAAVGFRDPGVANQHVSQTIGFQGGSATSGLPEDYLSPIASWSIVYKQYARAAGCRDVCGPREAGTIYLGGGGRQRP